MQVVFPPKSFFWDYFSSHPKSHFLVTFLSRLSGGQCLRNLVPPCFLHTVPEDHHSRGTNLREALRGHLPLGGFSGASVRVSSSYVSVGLLGSREQGNLRKCSPSALEHKSGCSRECSRECSRGSSQCTEQQEEHHREHSREHSREHPDLRERSREHSGSTFGDFPVLSSLAGQQTRKLRGFCGVCATGSAGVLWGSAGFSEGSDPILVTLPKIPWAKNLLRLLLGENLLS